MHVCMVVSCYDIIKYCKMAEEKSPILGRTSLERRHKISQDIEQKQKRIQILQNQQELLSQHPQPMASKLVSIILEFIK